MSDPRFINCGPSDPVTDPGDTLGYLRLRLERPLYYLHWGDRDMRADVAQFMLDIEDKTTDTVGPIESDPGAQALSPFALLDVRAYTPGAPLTMAELVAKLDPIAKNLALVIATVEKIGVDQANPASRDAALATAVGGSIGPRATLDSLSTAAKWGIVALVALIALIVAGETKKLVA